MITYWKFFGLTSQRWRNFAFFRKTRREVSWRMLHLSRCRHSIIHFVYSFIISRYVCMTTEEKENEKVSFICLLNSCAPEKYTDTKGKCRRSEFKSSSEMNGGYEFHNPYLFSEFFSSFYSWKETRKGKFGGEKNRKKPENILYFTIVAQSICLLHHVYAVENKGE